MFETYLKMHRTMQFFVFVIYLIKTKKKGRKRKKETWAVFFFGWLVAWFHSAKWKMFAVHVVANLSNGEKWNSCHKDETKIPIYLIYDNRFVSLFQDVTNAFNGHGICIDMWILHTHSFAHLFARSRTQTNKRCSWKFSGSFHSLILVLVFHLIFFFLF